MLGFTESVMALIVIVVDGLVPPVAKNPAPKSSANVALKLYVPVCTEPNTAYRSSYIVIPVTFIVVVLFPVLLTTPETSTYPQKVKMFVVLFIIGDPLYIAISDHVIGDGEFVTLYCIFIVL